MLRINEYKESVMLSGQLQERDITAITDEHHEKLKSLRLLFDNFMSNTETEFFDALKQIRFSSEQIFQPLKFTETDYGADNENSLRGSAINIETSEIEVEQVHPKFSREVHLSGIDRFTEEDSPKREKDVPMTYLKTKDTNVQQKPFSTPKFKAASKPPLKTSQPSSSFKAFIWGSGKDGRCGNSKQSSETRPYDLGGLMLKSIKSGYHHTGGITRDGVTITWG